MTQTLQVINDSEDIGDDLSPQEYKVPNTKTTIIMWANDTVIKVNACDLSSIISIPDVPSFIKDFCRDKLTTVMAVQGINSEGRDLITRQSLVTKIYIPSELSHVPTLIKAVLGSSFSSEDKLNPTKFFSAGFSALCLMGPKFQELVVKNLQHVILPIKQVLKVLGLEDRGSCTATTAVNMALMTICCMGKQVNDLNNSEFQKNRFKACLQSAGQQIEDPTPIRVEIMNSMHYNWSQFDHFVKEFVNRFLIENEAEGQSLLEKAIVTQAKLVCAHANMRTFSLSVNHVTDFLRAHWLAIPPICREVERGYKAALTFYCSFPEAKRPYIRLLREPGCEVLEYKNYPHIHYATGCLAKFESGNESMLNLVVDSLGILPNIQDAIKLAALTNIPVLSLGASTSASAMELARGEWQGILESMSRTLPALGTRLEVTVDSLNELQKAKLQKLNNHNQTRAIMPPREY